MEREVEGKNHPPHASRKELPMEKGWIESKLELEKGMPRGGWSTSDKRQRKAEI